ncbi:MAG: hypothetical protein Q7R79_03445 [bacterium]|nr:hypothetical protein [bacterium]
MIYPKDMDVLYASRDTDNLVYHIKNVAAAITVAEPALVKVLLTTRIDNKMPMEVARPFWYGCVLGVLQGLTARAEIDLNAVLISRTVRELASAFAGYLDEAVKYGYTSTFICESSKEVEQELSEAITKLTKKLGHRFADSFSEPFQGTERGFHEQVLRNVLIKSFAGATLLQLKTASRYRNHSSLAVLDTKAVISVGEIQTGTASPYRQQV